jgi:primary-amine oxidase
MRSLHWRYTLTALFAALMIQPALASQSSADPLDGLTAPEYWAIHDAFWASGRVDADTRYPFITLLEPPKDAVLTWKPGVPIARQALVVVRQKGKTFEAIVDIGAKKVVRWTERPGALPNVTLDDFANANSAVHDDPAWRAAISRRGITDLNEVSCSGASPGYYPTPEFQNHRLLRLSCYDRHGTYEPDARLIDGVVIVWDIDSQKIVRLIDTGVVPVATTPADYDPAASGVRKIPTPISMAQPLGPSFHVTGTTVDWQNWRFHFRVDRRVGLVVSNVAYQDGKRLRPILYEGSLSEIFVPYMDPAEDWFWATYFDVGEFADGFGSTLDPGNDCPDNAVYFDQVYADDTGLPALQQRAACLFERYSGDVAWRHAGSNDPLESRKRRDLVLRTVGTFSNYDYIFDWTFRQDGVIEIGVGLTGVDELGGALQQSATLSGASASDEHGRFVADHVVAPYHDHFFNFRLNFAVDGRHNSFVRDRLVTERVSGPTPRRSIWVDQSEVLKTESAAQLDIDPRKPEVWRVVNPSQHNRVGDPVGYEIVPGGAASPLLLPEDYPQRRAGFTNHALWVTPYSPEERYAAGDYPTQSRGGDGLTAWTKANRTIENTDLVVWYTMGFHHLPSSEDFPVMATNWLRFELRPFDFFDRNPAIDLPRS